MIAADPAPEMDLGLGAFDEARANIRGLAIRTPLLRVQLEDRDDIYIKLENLQPVGSFKIRCAANALKRRDTLTGGIHTASAGNFAQGLAYAGRQLGRRISTFVPDTAAKSKVAALRRLGADVVPVPYDRWWSMLREPSEDPRFIHPAADRDVITGNGTLGLEILEDLPNVATVIAPYGGGGLSIGVAAALKAAGSAARVIACETEAGTPLTTALAAGGATPVDFNPATFITGMGGPSVLPTMFPLARRLLAGTTVVSLAQVAAAIRFLVERHHLIVEGAGGAALAAAMTRPRAGPTVCILSGGHLDPEHLATILRGEVP